MANNHTVVGVFEDRGKAEAAMDHLRHAGFTGDDIGYAARAESGTADQTPTAKIENKAEGGAVTGAVTGGTLGALAGAAAVGLIPGIGPVIAGGMLVGILGGAAAGAAAGAYLGPFVGMGLSEEDARSYEGEFHAGRTVVTVRAGDRPDRAAKIMREHGAARVSA